jgi:putative membrane protein
MVALHLIRIIIFKTDKVTSLKAFMVFLEDKDFVFLFKLMVGGVIAIICLSSLMKYLIVYQFSVTYALFFGLILISIIIPLKMLTDRKAYLVLFVLFGAVSTIYVTQAVNPYDKVKMKSDIYAGQYVKDQTVKQGAQAPGAFSFTGTYTVDEYVYAAVCGAVAVSAMILPGISGSLVLILMGEYFAVVSAISGLQTLSLDHMAFLGCFAVGILLGGLLFARLVSSVLKRYYNATMAFLIGLMAGSLYALWPFKKSIVMAHHYIKRDGVISMAQNVRVYTNINEYPQFGTELYLSLFSFMIGCCMMFFFIRKELNR